MGYFRETENLLKCRGIVSTLGRMVLKCVYVPFKTSYMDFPTFMQMSLHYIAHHLEIPKVRSKELI